MSGPTQVLRVLPGALVVERGTADTQPADWVALVRAPDGLTVVRPVRDGESPAEHWTAIHGESAHGLDLPGMLVAVIRPLSEAGVPVFVASTFDADLVLVPGDRLEDAIRALVGAGHDLRR